MESDSETIGLGEPFPEEVLHDSAKVVVGNNLRFFTGTVGRDKKFLFGLIPLKVSYIHPCRLGLLLEILQYVQPELQRVDVATSDIRLCYADRPR